jgi:hypothetical protein
VAGPGSDELGKSAIDGPAGYDLGRAQVLVPLFANLTYAAAPIYPGNAYTITDFHLRHFIAAFYDTAGDLMSENERPFHDCRQLRPIAVGDVEVRMAYAGRLDFDQYLVRTDLGSRNIFYAERLLEFSEDSGFHNGSIQVFLEAIIRTR